MICLTRYTTIRFYRVEKRVIMTRSSWSARSIKITKKSFSSIWSGKRSRSIWKTSCSQCPKQKLQHKMKRKQSTTTTRKALIHVLASHKTAGTKVILKVNPILRKIWNQKKNYRTWLNKKTPTSREIRGLEVPRRWSNPTRSLSNPSSCCLAATMVAH